MSRRSVRAGIAGIAGIVVMLAGAASDTTGGGLAGRAEDLLLAATIGGNQAEDPTESRPGTVWNSCQTVPVRVNAPEHLHETIDHTLEEFNLLTGAPFRIVGVSSRIPQTDWAHDGERSEGRRWPDIIIAVADETETDLLRPGDRGAAVANPVGDQYVTGAIAIETRTAEQWNREGNLRQLLLHELGHLAGLRHSRSGLMDAHVRHSGGPDSYSSSEQKALRQNFTCTSAVG